MEETSGESTNGAHSALSDRSVPGGACGIKRSLSPDLPNDTTAGGSVLGSDTLSNKIPKYDSSATTTAAGNGSNLEGTPRPMGNVEDGGLFPVIKTEPGLMRSEFKGQRSDLLEGQGLPSGDVLSSQASGTMPWQVRGVSNSSAMATSADQIDNPNAGSVSAQGMYSSAPLQHQPQPLVSGQDNVSGSWPVLSPSLQQQQQQQLSAGYSQSPFGGQADNWGQSSVAVSASSPLESLVTGSTDPDPTNGSNGLLMWPNTSSSPGVFSRQQQLVGGQQYLSGNPQQPHTPQDSIHVNGSASGTTSPWPQQSQHQQQPGGAAWSPEYSATTAQTNGSMIDQKPVISPFMEARGASITPVQDHSQSHIQGQGQLHPDQSQPRMHPGAGAFPSGGGELSTGAAWNEARYPMQSQGMMPGGSMGAQSQGQICYPTTQMGGSAAVPWGVRATYGGGSQMVPHQQHVPGQVPGMIGPGGHPMYAGQHVASYGGAPWGQPHMVRPGHGQMAIKQELHMMGGRPPYMGGRHYHPGMPGGSPWSNGPARHPVNGIIMSGGVPGSDSKIGLVLGDEMTKREPMTPASASDAASAAPRYSSADITEESLIPDATDVQGYMNDLTASVPGGEVAAEILNIELRLCRELARIEFVEPVTHVYNPLTYALDLHVSFLKKFCRSRKTVLFLGMNPGPYGMSQNGIPFGDCEIVRDWLKVEGRVGKPAREHPKRPIKGLACHRKEVSGSRFWSFFREVCGTPEAFFEHCYIYNCCPFAFMGDSGKNLTPTDIKPTTRRAIHECSDRALAQVIRTLGCSLVVGVGKYAERRAVEAVRQCADLSAVRVGWLMHPSPRNPLANRAWTETGTRQLSELGVMDVLGWKGAVPPAKSTSTGPSSVAGTPSVAGEEDSCSTTAGAATGDDTASAADVSAAGTATSIETNVGGGLPGPGGSGLSTLEAGPATSVPSVPAVPAVSAVTGPSVAVVNPLQPAAKSAGSMLPSAGSVGSSCDPGVMPGVPQGGGHMMSMHQQQFVPGGACVMTAHSPQHFDPLQNLASMESRLIGNLAPSSGTPATNVGMMPVYGTAMASTYNPVQVTTGGIMAGEGQFMDSHYRYPHGGHVQQHMGHHGGMHPQQHTQQSFVSFPHQLQHQHSHPNMMYQYQQVMHPHPQLSSVESSGSGLKRSLSLSGAALGAMQPQLHYGPAGGQSFDPMKHQPTAGAYDEGLSGFGGPPSYHTGGAGGDGGGI